MKKKVPIFIISLSGSLDRQQLISKNLTTQGLKYEFIEAVDGKSLSEEYKSEVYNSIKAKEFFNRDLLLGEIGCALSHKKIYEKMIHEEIEYAVILEDDAIVDKSVVSAISTCIGNPFKWDLILLGHYATYSESKAIKSQTSFWGKKWYGDLNFLRLTGKTSGTHGYILTYEGAQKLYSNLAKITKPIDHYTSDDKLLDVYALHPTIINPNKKFKSSIDDGNIQRKNAKVFFMTKDSKKYHFIHFFWKLYKKVRVIRRYE